jgi:hypothetical protein
MNLFAVLLILLIVYVFLWACFGTGKEKRRKKRSYTQRGKVRYANQKRRARS